MATSSNSSRTSPPRKRQRSRRACLPCRQRKRKCDAELPCSMCTTYGYQCQFAPDDSATAGYVDNAYLNPQTGTTSSPKLYTISGRRPRRLSDLHATCTSSDTNNVQQHVPQHGDHGILDPVRTRYMGMHSLIAFPRMLGLDFQSLHPPRLHSFAWNCGIRPEEEGRVHADLRDLISREDAARLTEVYFETVHPAFGFLDEEKFRINMWVWWDGDLNNAKTYMGERRKTTAFEAILSGIIVLGSFFSPKPGYVRESQIVQHAKDILEDATLSTSIDHVSAWILRTLYLRSVSRPHRAWIASCTTMHLAEATGLHHEIDSAYVTVTTTSSSNEAPMTSNEGCEQARRIFWTAWQSNVMISYEYGRSAIVFPSISCKLPQPVPGSAMTHLIAVAQLVPRFSDQSQRPDLPGTLAELRRIPEAHPFLVLVTADLAMSLYRHARLLKLPIEKSDILSIIAIGNSAVGAASTLAREQKYWWNVLCTVFQYVCVLLAIDTSDSLSQVASTMAAFEEITNGLGTHMAKEALGTARVLLRDSVRKKRREVEMLEVADPGRQEVAEKEVEGDEERTAGYAGEEGIKDIDWDALLDPWYMSTFTMQDFGVLGSDGMGGVIPTV